MKNELRKKLGLYTLSSGAMLGLAANAGAQIVYTDFSDVTLNSNGANYLLDLDGDATDDFDVTLSVQGSTNLLYINTLNANAAVLQDPTVYNKATALVASDQIPATPTTPFVWGSSALMAGHTAASNYGDFKSVTNKYLGLRLKKGSDFVYGWLRVDANISTPTVILKDRAYNSTLNGDITAGQMTTGIEQSQFLSEHVSLFVNENNEIVLENSLNEEANIEIVGLDGKPVHAQEIVVGKNIIATNNFIAGMYLVHVKQGEMVSTRKIVIR